MYPDRRSPLRDLERAPAHSEAPKWAGAARVAVLAVSDAVALLLAGLVSWLAWALPVHGQEVSLYLAVLPAIPLILLAYAQAGLYPGFGLGPVELLRRYWLVTTLAFLVLASLVFGLKVQDLYSRVTLALAFVLSLVLLGLFRWFSTRLARRWSWWAVPVVVVGEPRGTRLTEELFRGRMGQEFRPVGIVRPSAAMGAGLEAAPAPEDFARAGVEVAFTDAGGPGSEALLERLRTHFPRVVTVRAIEELPVEGVQIRNLGGTLGLEYGNNLLRRQARWVKRTLDLLVGGIALVLSLPLLAGAILAVKVLSPGPALFLQPREGRGGRTIRVPKIRTMVVDAERKMEELFVQDPRLRDEWENGFKLREDPRIIPVVGRFLRRYSIDELPQLWSVLRGDMSLVGPRPFPSYHLEVLSAEARHLRAQVRPGISGLWQVSARGLADVDAQQSYDVYYIRNWSVWLDLHILSRTVAAVITGRGAY